MDNAPGFNDSSNPAYVLKMWQWDVRSTREDKEFGPALMNSVGVASLIIDCGKGNPGAIGFKCWGAQGIYVENLTVMAYGALAGIRDLIGNGGYMANIEVLGGKYGVWAQNGQPGCIAGLTLVDQEEAAIKQEMGSWPVVIAGFRIIKEKGPVIILEKLQNNSQGYHLSLTDGSIELRKKSEAMVVKKNSEGIGGHLYLRNVFVKNASVLVNEQGVPPLLPKSSKWSVIQEYSGVSKDTESYIDGIKTEVATASVLKKNPPLNLVSKHSLPEYALHRCFGQDIINVKDASLGEYAARGDGRSDDTRALQYAIDNHEKVFLPKGDYRITAPLVLRKNTALFGITSALSSIIPDADRWDSSKPRVVIQTEDDAESGALLSQVTIYTSGTEDGGGFEVIDWKAGRNSVVKNIYSKSLNWIGHIYPTVKTKWDEVEPRPVSIDQLVKISGNGGGRWYGYSIGCENFYPMVPAGYRHLLIDGTTQPLTFYSFNPEHACSDAEVEIRNSRNINLYGIKTENCDACEYNIFGVHQGHLVSFINSENFYATGFCSNGKPAVLNKALFRIVDCDNYVITTLSATQRNRGSFDILSEESGGGKLFSVPIGTNVGLVKRGNLNQE
jgi:polygalacturonase